MRGVFRFELLKGPSCAQDASGFDLPRVGEELSQCCVARCNFPAVAVPTDNHQMGIAEPGRGLMIVDAQPRGGEVRGVLVVSAAGDQPSGVRQVLLATWVGAPRAQ